MLLRYLQFWCKLNTHRIVKTCPFRFLRDYYSDSLYVMLAQFSKISLGVSTFSPVFPLFPISGFVAWEVIFSRKQTKLVHPDLVFNKMPVHQTHCQKHLGVYL